MFFNPTGAKAITDRDQRFVVLLVSLVLAYLDRHEVEKAIADALKRVCDRMKVWCV